MKYIILILLIVSCNPLRHYQKVARDQYPRSAEKRKILAPICAVEFPVQSGDPMLTKTEIDSTAYNALKSSNTALLQQYIQLQDSIYHLNPTTENKALKDSAAYVLNFLKTYSPPSILDIRYYERQVPDSAKQQQLSDARDTEYRGRLKAEAERTAKDDQLTETKAELNKWLWRFWILAGIVLVAIITFVVIKLKK